MRNATALFTSWTLFSSLFLITTCLVPFLFQSVAFAVDDEGKKWLKKWQFAFKHEWHCFIRAASQPLFLSPFIQTSLWLVVPSSSCNISRVVPICIPKRKTWAVEAGKCTRRMLLSYIQTPCSSSLTYYYSHLRFLIYIIIILVNKLWLGYRVWVVRAIFGGFEKEMTMTIVKRLFQSSVAPNSVSLIWIPWRICIRTMFNHHSLVNKKSVALDKAMDKVIREMIGFWNVLPGNNIGNEENRCDWDMSIPPNIWEEVRPSSLPNKTVDKDVQSWII